MFSCSDSSLLIPKSNCLLLAWCHLCCLWESTHLMHMILFNLQGIPLNESRKLLSNYFVKQLLWNSNEILRHTIFSQYQTIVTVIYQLLQCYLLICLRIQRFIFVITIKASTLVICSAVRAFTDKFRRPINKFFQGSLQFVLLILTVDSYFVLFIRLCLSVQECAHLMGRILLGVGSSEIGMFPNIVPITLQLALIGFFTIGNSFIIKDAG